MSGGDYQGEWRDYQGEWRDYQGYGRDYQGECVVLRP